MEYFRNVTRMAGYRCKRDKILVLNNSISFNSFWENLTKWSKQTPLKPTDVEGCEIGVNGWFITEERYRRNVVDFVEPFTSAGKVVLVQRENSSNSPLFFLSAFSFPVWSLIALLVSFFTFIKIADIHVLRRKSSGDEYKFGKMQAQEDTALNAVDSLCIWLAMQSVRKLYPSSNNDQTSVLDALEQSHLTPFLT